MTTSPIVGFTRTSKEVLKRALSPKRRNVVRRAMRVPPTYTGAVPVCGDCGCPTEVAGGHYGRFYVCVNWECEGTVSARLDGTPVESRGTAATKRARLRARDVIQQIVQVLRVKSGQSPTIEDDDENGNLVHYTCGFREIYDRLCKLVGYGKTVKCWPTGGSSFITTVTPLLPRLRLKSRTLAEAQRIEAAARVELRKLGTTGWDMLLEGLDEVG